MTRTANIADDIQFEYSPVSQVVNNLRIRHDQKFGSRCDRYDPDTNETEDELIVHCESCGFVIARLNK